jgi:hypothetical protein
VLEHRALDLRQLWPLERPLAGQQFVEHDAEREDVAARVGRLLQSYCSGAM